MESKKETRGRPKKIIDENIIKNKVGRPKKIITEILPKNKVGRPKKIINEIVIKQNVGRPKKSEDEKLTNDITQYRKNYYLKLKNKSDCKCCKLNFGDCFISKNLDG